MSNGYRIMLSGARQWVDRYGRGPRVRLWRAYGPILALIAVYYGTASAVLGEYEADIPIELVGAIFNIKFMLLSFVLAGAVFAYASLLRNTGERPLVRVRKFLTRQPYAEIILLRFQPVVLLMIPIQDTYTAIKTRIPDMVPYTWDATFVELDRLIFLGADPWMLTHWLLPWPIATWGVDIAYLLWFYLLMASLAAAAVMPLDSRLRLTYLLSCFLSWSVGGSLLAVMFSSAGPVYYERLFGDPMFADLMERLSSQNEIYPLIALTAQETLWKGYSDPAIAGLGISAFPSMHLCIAAGMTIFAWRLSRPLGRILAGFTAVMLFGSVHLGWHYAVDGFAGIALAFLFWRMSERFANWWFEESDLPVPSSSEEYPGSVPRHSSV